MSATLVAPNRATIPESSSDLRSATAPTLAEIKPKGTREPLVFSERQLIELRVAAELIKLLKVDKNEDTPRGAEGFKEFIAEVRVLDVKNDERLVRQFLEYFPELYTALTRCEDKVMKLKNSLGFGSAAEQHATGTYEDSANVSETLRAVDRILFNEPPCMVRARLLAVKNHYCMELFKRLRPIPSDALADLASK